MAAGDTPITVVGNLVADPELRFTASGQPVATFRIASTPRIMDRQTNEWKDGDSLFLSCNVWRQAAENVAESLQRGMRVIVTGRLKQRNYETKEGEKRTVYEVEVDDVGPSLRNASAKVARANRTGGAGGGYGGGGQSSGGGNQGGGYGGQNSGGQSSGSNQVSKSRPSPRWRGSPREHHDGEATNSQAQEEGLRLLPRQDHVRGLQGHGPASEVHFRPRQDPRPPGHR
jgi:single-strand DNA-binding protein